MFRKSEHFSEIGGNLKQGGNASWSQGDGRPCFQPVERGPDNHPEKFRVIARNSKCVVNPQKDNNRKIIIFRGLCLATASVLHPSQCPVAEL